MHFHLPKPLHGWREFAGEVGIIVIGVLIALGAEQIVQNIEAHRKAARAEAQVRDELIGTMNQALERIALRNCLQLRLGELARGLASGRKDWKALVIPPNPSFPTALSRVYATPSRSWLEDAYHGALTQGDLNSVSSETRGTYAQIYIQIDRLGELNAEEGRLKTQLAVLPFNTTLSQPERNQMIGTVAQLDWANSLIVLISRQILKKYRSAGYHLTTPEIEKLQPVWRAEIKGLNDGYGSCVDSQAPAQFDARLIQRD